MIRLLFILLIILPFKISAQREFVDTLNFKSEKLGVLIHNKINGERKRKKKDSIYFDANLNELTLNHVRYMANNSFVGHEQRYRQTESLIKRLDHFNLNNKFVSESVISIDLRKFIIKSKGRYSYTKLTKLIYDKWKKSAYDYQQIVNSRYEIVNLQAVFNSGVLYICNTFASKPFIESYDFVKGEPIHIKSTKPCYNCKKVQKKISNGLGHVGWYSVSNDSVYYWNTKYYYKGKRRKNNVKLIFNRKGTISIDVIHQEQFGCDGKTAFDRSVYHDGYYLGAITKKSLKNNLSQSPDLFKIYAGNIPAFRDTFFQVDLNYSKKKRACMNNSIVFVRPDFFEPKEYFNFPKPIVEKSNQIRVNDSLLIKVLFERNQTSEDIHKFDPLIAALDSITNEKHIVKTIFYTGIASIEGSEKNNRKLIRKRGKLIRKHLHKFYPEIEFKSQFYENFEDYRDGLKLINLTDIAKLNNVELRNWTNKHRDETHIAELLNVSRQSLVSVSFHDEIKIDDMKYTLSVKHVQDLIDKGKVKNALIYFQIMGHKAIDGDVVVKDSLRQLNIPQTPEFNKLNWNYFVYELNVENKKIGNTDLKKLLNNGAIKDDVKFLEYRLMFNIFNNSNSINTSDFPTVLTSVKNKKYKAWLNTLYLISNVQAKQLSSQAVISRIVRLALKNKFNEYQTYFVSQYLIDWGYNMEPYLLLSKFARQKNMFPKLYKQYVKLGYFLQQFNNKREWRKIKSAMISLLESDSREYCDLFKWNQMGVRTLENSEVAKMFCEVCK